MGVLVAINVSSGGIPKSPVPTAEVTESGLVGDGRAHAKHVKPTRALSLLDAETIEELRREGYPVARGVLGENLTIKELCVQRLSAGTRLEFAGGVLIELTQPREPCLLLDAVDARLPEATRGRIGWMARVITPGRLTSGETVEVKGVPYGAQTAAVAAGAPLAPM